MEFQFCDDRFIQKVYVGKGENRIEWLHSFDTACSENEILGQPVFQEVSIQKLNEKQSIAFLVGQAEKVHWSMSVEVDSSHQQLICEIAARVAGSSCYEALANSYRVLRPEIKFNKNIFNGEQDRMLFEHGTGSYQLKLISAKCGDADLLPKMSQTDDCLQIQPRANLVSLPATIGWKYAISWEKS